MIKTYFYILALSILSTNCNNDGQGNVVSKADKLYLTENKSTDTASEQTKVIEINCDSTYKGKGYQLKLVSLSNNDKNEVNYNFIFIVVKQTVGQAIEIYRDTLESSTQEIKFEDFNSDNIKDILIQNSSDVRSNWTYYLYVVHIQKNKLQKIKGFEKIKNPNYLPKYNLIDNIVKSGRDWTSFYKIQGDSIKDFGIVVYHNHAENETYNRDYDKAIETILKQEKNSR